MDITGARWGLGSAEAILKLRALITNNDFDHYWNFHLPRTPPRPRITLRPRDHPPTRMKSLQQTRTLIS